MLFNDIRVYNSCKSHQNSPPMRVTDLEILRINIFWASVYPVHHNENNTRAVITQFFLPKISEREPYNSWKAVAVTK